MPLSDDVIASAVKQYRREYDCYEKLCKVVASICEREIIRANTLRAGVTSRAKGPSKVQGKLQRKYRDQEELNTVEDALGRVSDLAGVRISTYLEIDRDKVVQEITKLFDGPGGAAVVVEKKDKVGSFYRATHCQVALKKDDLRDSNENLDSLTCEIQVCSLLAHVWNELEHDLTYKPTTGDLSEQERDSLTILGNLTLSGDVVVKQLFDANSKRVKQVQTDDAAFQDVYDFVTRMRDAFPSQTDFGSNAGELFEDLVELGLDTKAKVTSALLTEGYLERSAALVEQLQQYLQQQEDETIQVGPQSSDILLVLALETRLDDVLGLHPMGRGMGRPPRIASFATRFKRMKDLIQSTYSIRELHPKRC